MAHATFANSTYVVQSRPSEDVSCIDVIGWVAALAGGWATMTPLGQLDFRSYDLGAFGDEEWLDGGSFAGSAVPYADGDDADGGAFMTGGDDVDGGSLSDARPSVCYMIRSLEVGTDDIAVTGVRVTAQDEPTDEDGEPGSVGESALYGAEGYVLPIESNPLVAYGQAASVAAMVGPLVVGLTTRTVNATVVGDPSVQAGDPMLIVDRRQRAYRTYVTNVGWSSGGSQTLLCGAMAPSRQSSKGRTGVLALAVEQVRRAVRAVGTATAAARAIAEQADAVAAATGQHFWTDSSGVHVTQVERDDWDDPSSQGYHGGPNLLANSLGTLLREGLTNLAAWTSGAVAFYDGLGNAAGNVTAYFGRGGSRVGREDSRHVEVDDDSITMYGSYDNDVMTVSVSGWSDGTWYDVRGATYPLTVTFPRAITVDALYWTDFQPYATSGPVSTWSDAPGRGDIWDFDPETCELTLNRADWDPQEHGGDDPSYVYVDFISMRANLSSGVGSESTGGDSAALGSGVVADGYGQVALGRWNQPPSIDPLDPTATWPFVVGDGTDDENRHNALAVDDAGDTHVYGKLIASNIGTILSANATKSLTSGTGTSIASLSLAVGTWVIEGNVGFASDATGRRMVNLATASGSVSASVMQQTGVEVPAANGGITALHTGWITTRSATTTVHLNAYQDSGGSLSCTGYIRAIRIG